MQVSNSNLPSNIQPQVVNRRMPRPPRSCCYKITNVVLPIIATLAQAAVLGLGILICVVTFPVPNIFGISAVAIGAINLPLLIHSLWTKFRTVKSSHSPASTTSSGEQQPVADETPALTKEAFDNACTTLEATIKDNTKEEWADNLEGYVTQIIDLCNGSRTYRNTPSAQSLQALKQKVKSFCDARTKVSEIHHELKDLIGKHIPDRLNVINTMIQNILAQFSIMSKFDLLTEQLKVQQRKQVREYNRAAEITQETIKILASCPQENASTALRREYQEDIDNLLDKFSRYTENYDDDDFQKELLDCIVEFARQSQPELPHANDSDEDGHLAGSSRNLPGSRKTSSRRSSGAGIDNPPSRVASRASTELSTPGSRKTHSRVSSRSSMVSAPEAPTPPADDSNTYVVRQNMLAPPRAKRAYPPRPPSEASIIRKAMNLRRPQVEHSVSGLGGREDSSRGDSQPPTPIAGNKNQKQSSSSGDIPAPRTGSGQTKLSADLNAAFAAAAQGRFLRPARPRGQGSTPSSPHSITRAES